MPLPVIADTYRVSIDWETHASVRPVNVFHVRASGATVSDVADSIDASFNPAVNGNPFEAMHSGQQAFSFTVLPLDGASPGFIHSWTNTPAGGGSGEIIPQGAVVVSFHTGQRGPRGRGRMFVGPCRESVVADGVVDNTVQSDTAISFNAWFADMLTQTPVITPVIASYRHRDKHDIDSLRVDRIMGTQRRRSNQLR
jgi:hypothetical protein